MEKCDDEEGAGTKKARAKRQQYKPEVLKSLMPFIIPGDTQKGVGLHQDLLKHFRFVATYDHRKIELLSPEMVDNIPKEFRTYSKDGGFGADATEEQKDKALEKPVAWAWEKHKILTGEERPPWTVIVTEPFNA